MLTLLRTYYVTLLRRAFTNAFAAIGLTARADLVRSLVVWATTVLLLYMIGWNRIPIVGTDNPDATSEVRLGLSAVGAIVLIFVVALLWQLITLPARMDKEQRDRLQEIEKEIDADADDEVERQILSEMRKEGLRLYESIDDAEDDEKFHAWRSGLDAWAESVKQRLRDKWSVAALHDFEDAGASGGWTRSMNDSDVQSAIERKSKWLLSRYTSYFKSLDQLVRYGSQKYIGRRVKLVASAKFIRPDDE